ncbi:MAG: peptidylprolyl isomerase [Pseudomonadota bacterium]|nr:peptidylprolyl isomerase [Pseudomonadota bacterium]
MQIGNNKVAVITYTLTDNSGTVIDQATTQEPFAFIQGTGNIIPGLEKALDGKRVGDNINITVEPAEGYGERDDALTQVLAKDMFEGVDEITPGMQFHAQTPNGMSIVTVTAVESDQVTIDGNHPLAGVVLNFDVNVLEIRDATEDEIEHGHIHGESCDH